MEIVVNCLGKRCPAPIIETARAVKNLSRGGRIQLLADDPATENDLRAWARMTGNVIDVVTPTRFNITVGG